MATLIFLFSIVSNPANPVQAAPAMDEAPAPTQSMRYYGVEKLLAKFESQG